MTERKAFVLFLAAGLGGLAIVGPSDMQDREQTEARRAEMEAARPKLLRHELKGCTAAPLFADDGRVLQECAKYAVYNDGREVLVGLVKRPVVPQSTRHSVMARGERK